MVMDIKSAKAVLDEARTWPIQEQLDHRYSIIEAFRVFWDNDPTEDEFHQYTSGLVLQSRMLYIMVIKGWRMLGNQFKHVVPIKPIKKEGD